MVHMAPSFLVVDLLVGLEVEGVFVRARMSNVKVLYKSNKEWRIEIVVTRTNGHQQ